MVMHNDILRGDGPKMSWGLFFIGLFSMTRIDLGGSIAISEIIMVAMAPYVFIKEFKNMGKDGVYILVILLFLWFLGALFSDWYNGTYFQMAIKGIAMPIVYLACTVCVYPVLRTDVRKVKWLVLGVALSFVLSTFVFQRAAATDVDISAQEALARTVGYKLYYVNLLDHLLLLPVRCWFLSTPYPFSILAVVGMMLASLFFGARSAFVMFFLSLALLVWGGKSVKRIFSLQKHFLLVSFGMLILLLAVKVGYEKVVRLDVLKESEVQKYERQTSSGNSILNILMAGRVEFFVGSYAAAQHPIIGRGSWALDDDGIYLEFLKNYGSEADYETMSKYMKEMPYVRTIPFHSHIITYWMWHGIFGLIFWLYVLYLLFITLRYGLSVVADLYGYLVLMIPMFTWHLLFSPVGVRVNEAAFFVVCVLIKNIRQRSIQNIMYRGR